MANVRDVSRAYFDEEKIMQVLESSRKKFYKSRRENYKIDNPEIAAALDHINESEDYAKIIWRVQQGDDVSEHLFDVDYLAGAITNLKMFYSLEVIDGRNLHSLSKTLDAYWHAHQDFTFDYMRFCYKVYGPGQFLHHLPIDKRDDELQQVIRRRYDYSRTMLDKVYVVDKKFWGEGAPICCSYDSHTAEGFVFWRPGLIATEPACNLYKDRALNDEIQKKMNFVLNGFAERDRMRAAGRG